MTCCRICGWPSMLHVIWAYIFISYDHTSKNHTKKLYIFPSSVAHFFIWRHFVGSFFYHDDFPAPWLPITHNFPFRVWTLKPSRFHLGSQRKVGWEAKIWYRKKSSDENGNHDHRRQRQKSRIFLAKSPILSTPIEYPELIRRATLQPPHTLLWIYLLN